MPALKMLVSFFAIRVFWQIISQCASETQCYSEKGFGDFEETISENPV